MEGNYVYKKNNVGVYVSLLVIFGIIVAVCAGAFSVDVPTEYKSQYNCDLKVVSLGMEVSVVGVHDESRYNINGEIFSAYEDDLEMKNAAGEIVRITDDKYNLISQNEHVIMNGEDAEYICDGKIKVFADSYDIFDVEGNKVAYVKFNMLDTSGVMVDNDGNEIARYDSGLLRYDYVVSIFDGCEMDDESVLMMFASYVSDKRADAAN